MNLEIFHSSWKIQSQKVSWINYKDRVIYTLTIAVWIFLNDKSISMTIVYFRIKYRIFSANNRIFLSRLFTDSQDRMILVMIVCSIKLAYLTWPYTLPSIIIRNPKFFMRWVFPHSIKINGFPIFYWLFQLQWFFPIENFPISKATLDL